MICGRREGTDLVKQENISVRVIPPTPNNAILSVYPKYAIVGEPLQVELQTNGSIKDLQHFQAPHVLQIQY